MARRGFIDPSLAARHLSLLADEYQMDDDWLEAVLTDMSAAPDPDAALSALVGLPPGNLSVEALRAPEWRRRLVAVAGGSLPLNQHLVNHPADLAVLAGEPHRDSASAIQARLVAACLDVDQPASDQLTGLADLVIDVPGADDRLRLANRRELARIAGRDLTSVHPEEEVAEIGAELADLADAVVACALAIARSRVPQHAQARVGVVAMGKCGAQELNYLSDIDVIYVAEPASDRVSTAQALEVATKVVAAMTRICSAHTRAGSIWQVDAALRPEGNAGALVRSMAGMRSYYEKWAKNWEFQALLKARPMAGDVELAADFCRLTAERVWQVGAEPNFISDLQAMRQRVISLIPAEQAEREIKLGAGGLRDVEFSVQLLQLVHGRADERLRVRATLPGLQALVDAGYVGRAEGADLAAAYRFERTMEHRVQLYRLRRSHLVPDNPDELRVLARAMGAGGPDALWHQWRTAAVGVQRLRQRVFYSPLLATVSRLTTDELRLTPRAAADRLTALGFSDSEGALRHIGALTSGVSRTAAIQRQLMPAMLEWFAEGPNPDLGLLNFRQLSDTMGATNWYLRMLRDEGVLAERLARVLASSRYIADLLRRDPPSVQLLADGENLRPRGRQDLVESMHQITERHEEATDAIQAVRALRRRELFRLAVGDVVGEIDLDDLGVGLTDLASATIQAALDIARAELAEPAPPIGVVAMGRWGGAELSYASDADAMFVIPDDAGDQVGPATRLISRARGLLALPGPEPALVLDVDLRPEGRDGPLVRTLGSYLSYYQRWSSIWEAQALIRADHGAGDHDLTAAFLAGIDSVRWPDHSISPAQLAEIRRLKGRMERERIQGGTDPTRNTKLGPGGLSDVEWVVQLIQLRHAHAIPSLRCSGTMAALDAEQQADLISPQDADALADAWRLASRLRNTIMLVRNRASDQIPSDTRDVAAVALLLGYGRNEASLLLEDYRRTARHAAGVVARLFWGQSG